MRAALLAVLAAIVVSCGRGEPMPRARDTTLVPTPAGRDSVAVANPCPPTGQWARCSIVARLDAAGLAPRVDSTTTSEPPLTQPGILIHLYGSDLELFVFPDSTARRRAQARLDTSKYVAYDTPLPPLGDHPTLIKSANVIAILHSKSDHQRERVADVLGAGPPQPVQPPASSLQPPKP